MNGQNNPKFEEAIPFLVSFDYVLRRYSTIKSHTAWAP